MTQFYNSSNLSKTELNNFFKQCFSPQALASLAKEVRFILRSRKLDPAFFIAALLHACSDKEWTLSSIHRHYNQLRAAQGKSTISWEPFHDFLAKPQFKDFIDKLVCAVRQLSLSVSIGRTSDFAAILQQRLNISDVLLQDGCVVTLENNGLRETFKGTSGTAAKIHMTLSLRSRTPLSSVITSGTDNEKEQVPLHLLNNTLIICDAGYEAQQLFHDIEEHGGLYLIKVNTECMYKVSWQCCMEEDGAVSPGKQPSDANGNPIGVSSRCNKDKTNKDIIAFTSRGLKVRIVRIWNPNTKTYVNLATNIPPELLDIYQVSELYRSRWQVERLFRCYKGFAALSGSRSGFAHIQMAMIELSQMAADLKHLLAVMLETETNLPISPEKMAHSGSGYIEQLINYMLLGTLSARNFFSTLLNTAKDLVCSATSFINREKGKSLECTAAVIERAPYVSALSYIWYKIESNWQG